MGRRERGGRKTAKRVKFGTIGEPEATPGDGNNHGRCSRLAIGSLVTGPESLINRDYEGDGACERAPCSTTLHHQRHKIVAPEFAQACSKREQLLGREIITPGYLTWMKPLH